MNWGYKLMLAFIAFALIIGILVYKSMNTKYDLVSKDYYKDELRYQDKIDGTANAAKLSAIDISETENFVIVQFPAEQNGFKKTGDIWFYNSTDANADVREDLNVSDNGQQNFLKTKFKAKRYLVKISWKVGDTIYYTEKNVTIK